jgi:hypothetical protein
MAEAFFPFSVPVAPAVDVSSDQRGYGDDA